MDDNMDTPATPAGNGDLPEADGVAEKKAAFIQKMHEEVRHAVRDYLNGNDEDGKILTHMLEVSRHLSEKNLAASANTERAIFFSDFVGSCTLFRELGDVAAHELIQEYFEISQVSISKFSGEIIKYTGDGILALFPNTTESLKAALFARSKFEIHNKKFPLLPISVRMAVNVGEVIQDEIDAYGTSINLSARLCDACHPGQILCSNIVHLRNEEKGFTFKQHSEVFAKGFPVAIKTHFLQERRADTRHAIAG